MLESRSVVGLEGGFFAVVEADCESCRKKEISAYVYKEVGGSQNGSIPIAGSLQEASPKPAVTPVELDAVVLVEEVLLDAAEDELEEALPAPAVAVELLPAVPAPALAAPAPPATAALISSAVASGTSKFCEMIHPTGSFWSSHVFPFAVGSPMVPGLKVPLRIASVALPPTLAICWARARVMALLVAAAPSEAGSWCWETAAISGFAAWMEVQELDFRPTWPVLRSRAR